MPLPITRLEDPTMGPADISLWTAPEGTPPPTDTDTTGAPITVTTTGVTQWAHTGVQTPTPGRWRALLHWFFLGGTR